MRQKILNYIMAPVFFLLMLVDSHMTATFNAWGHDKYIWSTHLLLIVLLFSSTVLSKRYLVITTLILGILFDVYYVGVIGIYSVALPLTVWLIFLMQEVLTQNILTYFFGTIIFMTIFDVVISLIQSIFNLASIQGILFITHFLGSTLLVNILFFFVLYYPLKKLFEIK